jgi:hypothetical protein
MIGESNEHEATKYIFILPIWVFLWDRFEYKHSKQVGLQASFLLFFRIHHIIIIIIIIIRCISKVFILK